MAHIELRGVSKSFGGAAALRNMSLEIADGQFFVLLGETGAGKTTTLRVIAGLEKPDAGQVLIDGQDVTRWGAAERDVALVLQHYSLYPRYTVRQNLEFPLRSPIRRTPETEIAARVERVAKTLRIGHLLDRKTDRLSGGEMQRVSIGRAIVRTPQMFLMDEPLSALDAKLREALRAELKDLQISLGQTFLFVTHDQVEAMSMGDRIGVLNRGELVQVGTPQDIYRDPCNSFVARAVGAPAINLVPGRMGDGYAVLGSGIELPHPGAAGADGRALVFGVRPEDIQIVEGAPATAMVNDVENHGVEKIVTMTAGPHRLRATVPVTLRLSVGERVRFGWDAARVVLFDAASGRSLRHGG